MKVFDLVDRKARSRAGLYFGLLSFHYSSASGLHCLTHGHY